METMYSLNLVVHAEECEETCDRSNGSATLQLIIIRNFEMEWMKCVLVIFTLKLQIASLSDTAFSSHQSEREQSDKLKWNRIGSCAIELIYAEVTNTSNNNNNLRSRNSGMFHFGTNCFPIKFQFDKRLIIITFAFMHRCVNCETANGWMQTHQRMSTNN